MKRIACVVLLATLVATVANIVRAQVQLRPGEYSLTAEMDFAGRKMSHTDTRCYTAEDVKKGFVGLLMEADEDKSCKILNSKWSGNKHTLNMACDDDGLKMASNSEMTLTADSFVGLMTTKDSEGRTTIIKTTGKRIGECKK